MTKLYTNQWMCVWIIPYNECLITCIDLPNTVGVIKNETLVFVNFSAQDASILKIIVPFIKRRS